MISFRVQHILLILLIVACYHIECQVIRRYSSSSSSSTSTQWNRQTTREGGNSVVPISSGRRVVLNCSVELPAEIDPQQVQYQWEHDGQTISYNKMYPIDRVTRQDAGVYTCHASAYIGANDRQWSASYGLTLKIDEDISFGGVGDDEPEIRLSPGDPGPMIVRDGDEVYSRCSVDDPSSYTIRWIRRMLDGSEQELSPNALLMLSRISTADIQYPIYCQVTRTSDDARFDKMLNVQFVTTPVSPVVTLPPELQLTIEPMPAEDLAEGKVMRRCLFLNEPDINGLFDFRWLDQNGRVFTNGDTLYLKLDNLVDIGNYTCEAVHQQTASVYQANYRVTREEITAAPGGRPPAVGPPGPSESTSHRVIIRQNVEEAVIGQPHEMECIVVPPPSGPISYRWYYNDRVIGTSSVLRIPALGAEDLQPYVCKAEWTSRSPGYGPALAEANSNVKMALTRERMIEMIPPPGSIMVSSTGESRELHCEYSHLNPRSVEWYFDGQPMDRVTQLNSTGQFYRMTAMRVSIISIRNVQPYHAGKYECRVDGSVKQVNLIVQVGHGLEVGPEEETVSEMDAAEFHCRASAGTPNINRQLRWFFKANDYQPEVPLSLSGYDGWVRRDDPTADHTSFISRTRVRHSDDGIYICRLPEYNAEARGRLYVRAAPITAPRVYITPALVRVRANQMIDMECYVTDDQGQPINLTPQFRIRDTSIRFDVNPVGTNRIRLRIPQGLQASYNGTTVECFVGDGSTYATAVIVVEDACPQGFRRCRSGQCLPAGRFCDGVRDCQDGSDEDPALCTVCDPIAKKCENVANRPPIKDVYMIHWACDGEDDCGNGWDESNCPSTQFAYCQDRQFNCPNGRNSIPLAFVCDKDQDCPYGEDEQNCASPIIEHTSNYRHTVSQGGTVRLECTVRGHPLPRVIWRFNWGCLPENQRFRITHTAQNCNSQMPSVVSVLTISGIQPGDDGIYNCEALTGSVRAMSNDYFVMMNN